MLSFLQTFQKTNPRICNSIFNVLNSLGLTCLTGVRVGLNHLRKHKFRHTFRDLLNQICNCGNAIEPT